MLNPYYFEGSIYSIYLKGMINFYFNIIVTQVGTNHAQYLYMVLHNY